MRKELNNVHFLRAFASLAVCLFHLFLGNKNLFPQPILLKQIFSFGYLGVEIFFMLSGFIICYALPKNYTLPNFKYFITKRIYRIQPPYMLSMALVLIFNSISYYITGLPNKIDWLNVGMNLIYINSFGPGQYLNVVYWTLGIEFQFYLIIALIYPLIKNKGTIAVFMLCLLASSCIPMPTGVSLIFPYLSIFGIGMLIFYRQITKTIDLNYFLFFALILLTQIYFFLGLPVLLASLLCILLLLFWSYDNSLINFFSTISFSLYLTHVTVGGKVVNLGLRFANTLYERYLLFILALAISIGFSYIFYLLIEKPAISWSKRIHYKIVKTT
jgi:peptidoglycan/LPS O-acetylase OafA/YrhL